MTYPFQISTQSATPARFHADVGSTGLFDGGARLGAESVRFNDTRTLNSVAPERSLGDRLFEATAEAKRWTSRVAMRMSPEARRRIFTQLDRLHDEDEWHDSSHPMQLESYKTFVRSLVAGDIGGKPSLALTARGFLSAAWQSPEGRLLVEFHPGDRVRYLVTQVTNGTPERTAGDTSVSRLSLFLVPFGGAEMFNAS